MRGLKAFQRGKGCQGMRQGVAAWLYVCKLTRYSEREEIFVLLEEKQVYNLSSKACRSGIVIFLQKYFRP